MISKLLVANRGEIAARLMRTARERDIATVAVYSDADADAPFVRGADEAVHLPGNTPAETYLRGDLVIAAARCTGTDAIHPGYGFLSENAQFAADVVDAGLIWVGPAPSVIEAMGSKIAAKELMAAAGVPVLPGITVTDVTVATAPDFGERVAREIGYPILVKAALGGGGRGMRVARDAAELPDMLSQARREAAAAFGDGTVFLERFVDQPRHVEVQIIGDGYGNVVSLFERECSIQRRYQKIIEEAPSPAVDDGRREDLSTAAVTAGKAIGYVGAGTVEFLLDADGRFYFLEVNTRLQVEHPVTELVTGLDLVALQLHVAEGGVLPDEALMPARNGHAIEVRLYAEDVAAGFLPAAGKVHTFTIPQLPGIRIDAGVEAGSEVGVHYDAMLAKVIAHGADRDQACRRLARALAEARIHGVVTNRELLVGILREQQFRAGQIDTGYLTRHDPQILADSWRDPDGTAAHAVAAALAAQAARRETAPVLRAVASGWRNVHSAPQQVLFSCGEKELDVLYQFGRDGVQAEVNGAALADFELIEAEPDRVVLRADGVRRELSVRRVGNTSYVDSPAGSSTLVQLPRFPARDSLALEGSLMAPMPGMVVRVAADVGTEICAGTPVVVLEAMKMEHIVVAPHDGTIVSVCVAEGQQVDIGTVLAIVDAGEPAA